MENSNVFKLIMKSMSRDDMQTIHKDDVLRNRELLLEYEGEGDKRIYRFKLGDGITPYNQLSYISSLYALYPMFNLYNNSYTQQVQLLFENNSITDNNNTLETTNINDAVMK